jgi:hypothetical protein
MQSLRKYISVLFVVWFCSVVMLDLLIPLHFFAIEHAPSTCHSGDTIECISGNSSHCEICAFDLYIGYPPQFHFEVVRSELLLAIFENLVSNKIIFKTIFFAQLRGPPVA